MPRPKNTAKNSKNNGRKMIYYKSVGTQILDNSRQKLINISKSDQLTQTNNHYSIDNDMTFTISILIFGLSYQIARNVFNFNGIEVCSEKTFYKYQNQISPIIIQMAKESAKNFSEKIENDTIISIDGAWDHRRHGTACIVTFIDIKTRKIIDFEISTTPKQFVHGNTNECSRNLEKVSIEKLVERWKHSQKFKYYIHDNDGVTRNIINNSGWKIIEILDVGHALKSLKKNLEKFNKREGKPFNGLIESMNRYLNSLFRNNSISTQKRIDLYYHMPEHYTGNHSHCIHNNNTKLRLYSGSNKTYFKEKLNKFLKENDHYAQKINPNYNTQNNECFNRLKTKFLSKNIKYSTSIELRLSEAVLEWNDENWTNKLMEKLNIDKKNSINQFINSRKQSQKKKNEKKRTEPFKESRRKERNAKLSKKINQNKKANGYKPNAKKLSFN